MSSFRKFFAKLFPSRRTPPRHQVKSTESLPAEASTNHESYRLTNTDTFSKSLPASLHGRTQTNEEQIQDIQWLAPDFAATGRQSMEINPISPQQPFSTMSISEPWDAWAIDRNFLIQVYDWNVKHPENSLDRIFKKISTALEQHQVLLELVPDGPIPIRGFVKALAHVVKLGTIIAEAKVEALQFAQNVLQWVEKLAAAFRDHHEGVIPKTWEDLADIRKLIEDVCLWAHKMLIENSGLTQRAAVKDTISQFQKQFTEHIEHFEVVSHIRLAIGQDHIKHQLQTLHDHFVQVPQSAMPDVTFEYQNKIPCDPGTRKQVLSEIMNWIDDISDGSPCFFWLSGDPGVGKSAVTASIAKECIRRNILWAQYFINRNEASTIDPQLYFPSITKQMSQHAVAVDSAVREILKKQPHLMKDDVSIQATDLFIKAVQVASESTPALPVAIVIDALDETDFKRLKVTAEVFSRILVDLPKNVKVFISSRVENVIRDNFGRHPRAKNIHLSARTSVADVSQYLEMKVHEIMTEFHIDQSHWGHERTQKLCSQASGLFIWAVTAIAYLQAEIEDFGTERLVVVLDELNARGMHDINLLYRTILKQTYQREASPWQTQCFQRIMGGIFAQQSPLSIDDLKGLLDLRNPTIGTPVDVEHFIRRFRTVLVPGVREVTGRTIPRAHKSFADFITSAEAQEFRVDIAASHGELALQCIQKLLRLWEALRIDEMPGQLQYATSHWSSHLTRVVSNPGDPDDAEDNDSEESFDDETTLLSKSPPFPVEPRPTDKLASSDEVYHISISPDGRRLAYARGVSVLLRDLQTGDFINDPFNGHTDVVRSVTFSPDGRYIVSTSDDKTIRIWDTETGRLVGGPLQGHTHWVLVAAFSPDGRQIVSGSADYTVRVWNAETGDMLHVFEGHTRSVFSAFFSPDARYILSVSSGRPIHVRDVTTGTLRVLQDLTQYRSSAFFSADGKYIISASRDGAVTIWDAATSALIPEYFASSGISNATLAFTSSGTAPYIKFPPVFSIKNPDDTIPLPAYVFVAGSDGHGTVGGISDAWLYFNRSQEFTMSTYMGQLIMVKQW